VAIRLNPVTAATAAGPTVQTGAANPAFFKAAAVEAAVRIGGGAPARPPCARRDGEGRMAAAALPGKGDRCLRVGQILGVFVRTPPVSRPQSPAVKPQVGRESSPFS
jgi:hypothetical protein